MLLYPLAINLQLKDYLNDDKLSDGSILKLVLHSAAGPMSGLVSVGIGIASIFLLFVIFIEVSSIMSGQKFQLKMLTPLLIYFFVCNFNFVSKPVTAFITKLQSSCVKVCEDTRQDYLHEIARNAYDKNENITFWMAFWTRTFSDDTHPRISAKVASMDLENPVFTAALDSLEKQENNKTDEQKKAERQEKKGIFATVRSAIDGAIGSVAEKLIISVTPHIKYDPNNEPLAMDVLRFGFFGGMVGGILDLVLEIFSFFTKCLGAVMIAIIVAFGPITWAFAVLPGHGRECKTWFIRLCQFALYAPICSMIQSFFAFLFYAFADNACSLLLVFSVMASDLIVLMEVPQIASMVIEGASGYVSATQGLNTIANMGQMVTGFFKKSGGGDGGGKGKSGGKGLIGKIL